MSEKITIKEKPIRNKGINNNGKKLSFVYDAVGNIVTISENGVQKVSQRKLFPGYVMIHMIMNDDTWYVVRNTRGVTGFVGPGSKPVPLDETEMEHWGIGQTEVKCDYEIGDMITVLSGAWEGTAGVVNTINEQKQSLTINVELFGRETPVELNFSEIKKMD